jgi:alpha-glucosidase
MTVASERGGGARLKSGTQPLLGSPHHDGSDLYLVERPGEIGDEAVVRLRVPRGTAVDAVALRCIVDGDPLGVRAEIDEETETDTWWRASVPVRNPEVRYRFLLTGGELGYAWANGTGLVHGDVADADDFVVSVDPGGPDWHLRSVVYEIFPDRFASSGLDVEPPGWAVPRAWDELPGGRSPTTSAEWFGGDLRGVEQHLDHVERLGADAIYLTPVFPAGSTHRYDANTFDRVDPLLGGDEALASLVTASHARGIHILGDLTPNHCGRGHEWFQRALADPDAPERDFFFFDDDLENGYESWYGVPALPKLDWSSEELRERMLAVTRRWLEAPYALDGWRIDVANMAGRFRDVDLNHAVARWIRDAAGDKLLVAEHGHDYRPDLRCGGWHGAMNYAGFLRPVWTWLRRPDLPSELRTSFWGIPAGLPCLDGTQVVRTMRGFRAGVAWSKVLHSWPLLDSHDVARFRTVSGSRDRHVVGIGLQMTTPGVPMVFAGDEIGLEGEWGEDARRTMPWSRPETWDKTLLDEYRRLIALRRSSDALARGGIRYVHVSADAIAYLRETDSDRILCLASRDGHAPARLPLAGLACRALETLYGGDTVVKNGDVVLPADGPSFHAWRLIDG